MSIEPDLQLQSRCILRDEVAIEDFEDGSLALLCEQLRLVQLNPTARDIVGQLDGARTIQQVTEAIAQAYGQPFTHTLSDVQELLAGLEALNVVECREKQKVGGRERYGRYKAIPDKLEASAVKSGKAMPHVVISDLTTPPHGGSYPTAVLALHASATVTPCGAVLFLGHAGAGKSTICRLLSKRCPLLADDVVYLIRQEDGTWRVADGSRRAFGGPLQAGELAELEGVPLCAILRLFQDSASRVATVTSREACRHLTDALFEVVWQQHCDLANKCTRFALVADIARQYSGSRLYFTLDEEPFELVFNFACGLILDSLPVLEI